MRSVLGQQAVEQLVLGLFNLRDGGDEALAVMTHGVGVLLCLLVLTIGNRGLGDEGAQARLIGRLGQMRQLFVDNLQLAAETLESLGRRRQPLLE